MKHKSTWESLFAVLVCSEHVRNLGKRVKHSTTWVLYHAVWKRLDFFQGLQGLFWCSIVEAGADEALVRRDWNCVKQHPWPSWLMAREKFSTSFYVFSSLQVQSLEIQLHWIGLTQSQINGILATVTVIIIPVKENVRTEDFVQRLAHTPSFKVRRIYRTI